MIISDNLHLFLSITFNNLAFEYCFLFHKMHVYNFYLTTSNNRSFRSDHCHSTVQPYGSGNISFFKEFMKVFCQYANRSILCLFNCLNINTLAIFCSPTTSSQWIEMVPTRDSQCSLFNNKVFQTRTTWCQIYTYIFPLRVWSCDSNAFLSSKNIYAKPTAAQTIHNENRKCRPFHRTLKFEHPSNFHLPLLPISSLPCFNTTKQKTSYAEFHLNIGHEICIRNLFHSSSHIDAKKKHDTCLSAWHCVYSNIW